jgi:glycosyltransferase involved in cell wall biosynthesis
MSVPKVSVLMPVYNGGKFLAPAIESILKQSLPDLKLIVINDGSKDQSDAVVRAYAERDCRIRYFSRENRGLIFTLNEGLGYCTGKYVARMDADDIALPDRLKQQFEFMEGNPEVLVCGTSVRKIDEHGNPVGALTMPDEIRKVRAYALFRCPLMHPTTFFRNHGALSYDPAYRHSEDYELWMRLLASGESIVNLKTVGLLYRETDGNITSQNAVLMKEMSYQIRKEYLQRTFSLELPRRQLLGFCNVVHRQFSPIGEGEPSEADNLRDSLEGFIDTVSAILAKLGDSRTRSYAKLYAFSHFLGYTRKCMQRAEGGTVQIAPSLACSAARLLCCLVR